MVGEYHFSSCCYLGSGFSSSIHSSLIHLPIIGSYSISSVPSLSLSKVNSQLGSFRYLQNSIVIVAAFLLAKLIAQGYPFSIQEGPFFSYFAETDLKKVKGTALQSIPLNSIFLSLLRVKLISRLRMNCLTFNSIFAANLFMTSSQSPLILRKANLSRGVVCRFTITNLPLFATCLGMSAAGVTVRELPMARHRSASQAQLKDRFNSYSGRFQPKFMMESRRMPLHFQHFREVQCQNTFWLSRVRKSLKNSLPHFLHFSRQRFPWSSANFLVLNPDLMCSPSVFCETKYFKNPASSRATKVIWVKEGRALAIQTTFLFLLSGIFWAFFYQAPGPVYRTVLTPDRKSGMPQAVLMPAPVKAMKCLLWRISLANWSIFLSSTSSESKNYFFQASVLWAVWDITVFVWLQKNQGNLKTLNYKNSIDGLDYLINYIAIAEDTAIKGCIQGSEVPIQVRTALTQRPIKNG